MNDPLSTTLRELLRLTKQTGAGAAKVVLRDDNEQITAVVIAAIEESAPAVHDLVEQWEKGNATP